MERSSERLRSSGDIDRYTLPEDGGWQFIDEVPRDFVQIVELQRMAKAEGRYVEEIERRSVDLDDVHDVFDDWGEEQSVLVSRDEYGDIAGMISYYYTPEGAPFLESVAVDPEYRGQGIGGLLVEGALEGIRSESEAEFAIGRAQGRVVDMFIKGWSAEVIEVDQATGQSKIAIPLR